LDCTNLAIEFSSRATSVSRRQLLRPYASKISDLGSPSVRTEGASAYSDERVTG
jgi:hypothetical protein